MPRYAAGAGCATLSPTGWADIVRPIMTPIDESAPLPISDDVLATPHLFRHHYDIDTLIMALCTGTPARLETGAGSFPVTPLPASFLDETLNHPNLASHPEATQTAVRDLSTQPLAALPDSFNTPAGDWLRARVKDAALEWLDNHNLIPPSMRHVPRQTRSLKTSPKKVTIS
ncbi:MAG: hypothetical protein WAZ18_04820 [Alphaproteobacteria bacterium]